MDISQFGFKIKEEIKPDVCFYKADISSFPDLMDDVLSVSQMLLLSV